MNLVRLFLPSYINNLNTHSNILRGYFKNNDDGISIYFTKCISETELFTEKEHNNEILIHGVCHNVTKKKVTKLDNIVVINMKHWEVNQLVINGQNKSTSDIIILIYEYDKIRDSQVYAGGMADGFSELQSFIHKENGIGPCNAFYVPNIILPYWLSSSMFFQHISNYINIMKWLVYSSKKDKKISIMQGNLIMAVITDVVLGYILLQLISHDTKIISTQLMFVLENIINMLNSLLTWLMGAPVGLKLNTAFNKMLGRYFFYHVRIWWMFLDTCSTYLELVLRVYQYIGYLGFTFQIAVISDMICLATFHAYCIYVYAARLFNIQISGLIALMRLFVGRKYNPLRQGIDSCEYTNQELFVGTVAFTILLLLLPSTTMYYIVFTVFRVLSLAVQHLIAKLIYVIQTLPFYVLGLWLTRSSKVAGDIFINIEHNSDGIPVVLKVKLLSKSILELIKQFKPPVEAPKQVEWTNFISRVLKGKQII